LCGLLGAGDVEGHGVVCPLLAGLEDFVGLGLPAGVVDGLGLLLGDGDELAPAEEDPDPPFPPVDGDGLASTPEEDAEPAFPLGDELGLALGDGDVDGLGLGDGDGDGEALLLAEGDGDEARLLAAGAGRQLALGVALGEPELVACDPVESAWPFPLPGRRDAWPEPTVWPDGENTAGIWTAA
jgi:hypothetical protein